MGLFGFGGGGSSDKKPAGTGGGSAASSPTAAKGRRGKASRPAAAQPEVAPAGPKTLHQAAYAGDVAAIERFLKEGESADSWDAGEHRNCCCALEEAG